MPFIFNEDKFMKIYDKEHSLQAFPLVKLTVVSALLLGTMASTAEANVCRKAKARPPCVESLDVRPNSITGISIVDNSLTGADVQDNSLTATDQADEAGADFASGEQTFFLTGSAAIVRSVIITAPTAGRVIVNANGSLGYGSTAAIENVDCSITTGVTVDDSHVIRTREQAAASYDHVPFAATRGFVVAAGSTTFNLVCNGPTTIHIDDSSLTAIFVPTAY
jgi:hypothetical protein